MLTSASNWRLGAGVLSTGARTCSDALFLNNTAFACWINGMILQQPLGIGIQVPLFPLRLHY